MIVFLRFHLIALCYLLLLGCNDKRGVVATTNVSVNETSVTTKINGVSFVASRDTVSQENIDPVLGIHANYAAVMPFGFIRSTDHPEIVYNTNRQWFGETHQGVSQYTRMLQRNGIHVMLKPQIWIWNGKYTGYLEMTSEEDWKLLEESYKRFILEYAYLAEAEDIEMLCIGTELEKFVQNRPKFWKQLIADIKSIYDGKLTYAANWDEYKRFPFWEELDFIGVDAYFPVADSKTPTIAEAMQGWTPWLKELAKISEKENKQILFTEYGYRSVDFSGKEPWRSDRELNSVNLEAQNSTMQALFDSVWEKEWFAGGFLWKWFIDHQEVGGVENSQFTPQNKPVEAVIKKQYDRFK